MKQEISCWRPLKQNREEFLSLEMQGISIEYHTLRFQTNLEIESLEQGNSPIEVGAGTIFKERTYRMAIGSRQLD